MSSDASSAPAATCPSCGKVVDPLRAGEVAILGGGFRYFCDRNCKVAYLEALTSGGRFHEDQTAEPPPVSFLPAVVIPENDALPANVETNATSARDGAEDLLAKASNVQSEKRANEVNANGAAEDADGENEDDAATPLMNLPPVAEKTAEAPAAFPPPAAAAVVDPIVAKDAAEAAGDAREEDDAATVPLDLPPLREGLTAPSRISLVPPESVSERSRALGTTARPTRPSRLVPLRAAGIVLGLGAAGAASFPDAHPAALALAVLATVSAIGCALYAEARLPGARIPREWPLLLALVAALLAHAQGATTPQGMHAYALDSLTGLLAAALLGGEALFANVRIAAIRAHAAIAKALDVPVHVVRGESVEIVAATRVKPGETVIVSAGETCGVDGAVGGGVATVVPWHGANESVTKREGDVIVAGAVVTDGQIRVTTAWTGRDRAWIKLAAPSTVAGAAQDNALEVAAPLSRLASQIADLGPVLGALLVGVASYLTHAGHPEIIGAAAAGGGVLATLAVVRAVAQIHGDGHLAALGRGIVYKDPASFDRAGRADVAVVCAQGTVLAGEPEIALLESLSALHDERAILGLAAGAESASPEPLAAALLHAVRARGERPADVRSATYVPGLGVSAVAGDGERLLVGSRAFLLQEKVSVAKADERVSDLEAQGRNVLLIAFDSRLVGLIALQDVLRPGAKQAVERLGDVGLEPVLLSGDARQTCENVAAELGVEHIRPEVLPADRGAEVRALGEGGHIVAVLGRAREDDGALGAADVSVAMASAGASPGEWTVSLASEDVRDAALALALAKRVHERARLAMISSFVAAGAGVLTLAFALAPLWVAPLAAFVGSFLAWRIVTSTVLLGPPSTTAETGAGTSPVSARRPSPPPKNVAHS